MLVLIIWSMLTASSPVIIVYKTIYTVVKIDKYPPRFNGCRMTTSLIKQNNGEFWMQAWYLLYEQFVADM